MEDDPELGVLVERALKNKDWEELREFLRYDSGELLHYCAVRGEEYTVLHFAVLHGELDLVKILIHYIDVDIVNKLNDATSLFVAAERGHVDVMKVLIQNGADVNAVDEDEETALHKAAEEGMLTL